MYLTYPLVMMAGSVLDVRSSIAPYLDLGVVLALIAGPVIYLAAVPNLEAER